MIGTLGLAFLAGGLSVLSPCVLPLLPIVLGSAASEHRLGPAALAAGLAVSFTAIGLFVATIGFAAGIDTGFFRMVSALLLIAVGVVLLLPKLQEQFALAAAPVSNWAGGHADNFTPASLPGQFGLGLLLGAVWSPASARPSAPPRFSPPRARSSARWRSPCSPSASAPRCRSCCSAFYRAKRCCVGAAG